MTRGWQKAGFALLALALAAAVLWTPLDAGVTRIVTDADIARPPAEVFAYVTTPGHWPEWHPSSLAVRGDVDHPLRMGEVAVEDFEVAGRRGRVHWRVTQREPDRLWQIAGDIEGREAGTVTYRLSPVQAGTHFVREFDDGRPNLLFALLDWIVLHRRIDAESQEAVGRLKDRLEKKAP